MTLIWTISCPPPVSLTLFLGGFTPLVPLKRLHESTDFVLKSSLLSPPNHGKKVRSHIPLRGTEDRIPPPPPKKKNVSGTSGGVRLSMWKKVICHWFRACRALLWSRNLFQCSTSLSKISCWYEMKWSGTNRLDADKWMAVQNAPRTIGVLPSWCEK